MLLSACGTAHQAPAAGENAKRYPLKGTVVSVDKDKKRAKVDHEEIPGFMERMVMDFPIHEDWVWNDLRPGAEIRAELVVDSSADEPYWLEKIAILAAPIPGQEPPPTDDRFAQIGSEMPDFKFTNQDGKPVAISDFRGKTLAITFIYAQCPLPEFCIKMSRNFSDAANRIAEEPEAKENLRLLSISFDPERDTPEKLKQYGLGYLGKDAKDDLSVWQLAVGNESEVRGIADYFGLRYEVDENDKTQFLHSLRTAVISPDGKVAKIFPDNEWTANDLIREMKAASQGGK